ncbi:MAG TPA: UDP-N-acetylglucosamine 2-epimerase (non-hydrolyzing) [Streptosporangiaceae bacterium]|jgi:UDP-N-acetylglucosamine 2-epimerase (non-hydrolysing)
MQILVAAGTRPEIIKLSPVVRALRQDGHDVRVVATGQHADPKMAAHMFDGLGYRPDVTWALPATTVSARVGAIFAQAIEELSSHRPGAALVLGDTDTAPLVALAARRQGIGVIHVEAGLRSFNGQSSEEVNRRVMAAIATLNLAPTRLAAQFLRAEGVPAERIHIVGNPVIDVLAASGVPRCPVSGRCGVLFTAHRATNVDRPERLRQIASLLAELGSRYGPVIFPVHPRTERRLTETGLLDEVKQLDGVQIGPPLAFHELLGCLARSKLVVTDSGGLQEEAAFYGLPAIIMRDTTPRWEGIQAGIAALCSVEPGRVLEAAAGFLHPRRLAEIAAVPCPYGDGDTGPRIAALLRQPDVARILAPRECDLSLPGADAVTALVDRPARWP